MASGPPASPEPSHGAFESLFAAAEPVEAVGRLARALHAHQGCYDGELTFEAGDALWIFGDASQGWTLGALKRESGVELEPGLIPRNWWQYVDDETPTDSSAAPGETNRATDETPVHSKEHIALDAQQSDTQQLHASGQLSGAVTSAPVADAAATERLAALPTRPPAADTSSESDKTADSNEADAQVLAASDVADTVAPTAENPSVEAEELLPERGELLSPVKQAGTPRSPARLGLHQQSPSLPIDLEYSTGHVLRAARPARSSRPSDPIVSVEETVAAALRKGKATGGWVSSGASDWVMHGYGGAVEETTHRAEGDSGWRAQVPNFDVRVHSPEQRRAPGSRMTFTVFHIDSHFDSSRPMSGLSASSSFASLLSPDALTTLSVERRFSQFVALDAALRRLLPLSSLPVLPARRYLGRFSDDFVECRRRDLERWLSRLVRHPLARESEALQVFLSCAEDDDFAKRLVELQSATATRPGSAFYAHVLHDDFLDVEATTDEAERLARHVEADQQNPALQGLEIEVFGLRNSYEDLGTRLKGFGRALVGLWAASGDSARQQQNEQGAWCWRERCPECLRMTKALQATADALDGAGNAFQAQARGGLLPTHELAQELRDPASRYSAVLETQQAATVALHAAAVSSQDDTLSGRAETVLHATTAELDHLHAERAADHRAFATSLLDAQIAAHTAALASLRAARAQLDGDVYDALSETGPRVASKLEYAANRKRPTTAGGASALTMPSGWTSTRKTSGVWSLLGP